MAFTGADFTDAGTRQWLGDIEAHVARFQELGCHAVSISRASPDALARLAEELTLSFPLLTDSDCTVATQFHAAIQIPSGPLTIPSMYLVNPERKIRLSNRGMPSVAAVLRSIQALQQATRQGM